MKHRNTLNVTRVVFFLIMFIPTSSFSQKIDIKGRILDDSTNVVIPFSTVAVKNKDIGVATGIDGTFNLIIEEYNKDDSLEFRSLGYKDYYVLLRDFLNNTDYGIVSDIRLTPISFNLSEIEVFPTKEEETFGTLINLITGPAYSFPAGAQVAVFIPNNKGNRGIIRSVSYLFTGKRRKPTAPFRVRVLEADQNGRPGKDLLLKSVIVSAPKSDKWFTVNLEKYNLPIPENGYFAGLELIHTDKKYKFKLKKRYSTNRENMTYQGPSLGLTRTKKTSHTWLGKVGKGWGKYWYTTEEGYSFNYTIRSTVKYEE